MHYAYAKYGARAGAPLHLVQVPRWYHGVSGTAQCGVRVRAILDVTTDVALLGICKRCVAIVDRAKEES